METRGNEPNASSDPSDSPSHRLLNVSQQEQHGGQSTASAIKPHSDVSAGVILCTYIHSEGGRLAEPCQSSRRVHLSYYFVFLRRRELQSAAVVLRGWCKTFSSRIFYRASLNRKSMKSWWRWIDISWISLDPYPDPTRWLLEWNRISTATDKTQQEEIHHVSASPINTLADFQRTDFTKIRTDRTWDCLLKEVHSKVMLSPMW